MSTWKENITLICLVAIATFSVATASDISRIVGGKTISVSTAPYIVQFRHKTKGYLTCAGTLVAPRFVVTAAHCFNRIDFIDVLVLGGVNTLYDTGVRRTIEDIILHPRYHPETMHSDLAILKLSSDMKGKNIKTIPLCSKTLMPDDYLQVSGWGRTDEGHVSYDLQTVRLNIIPQDQCEEQHLHYSKHGICAFVRGEKSACNGDSGGPAINEGELCGVVSFGKDCGSHYYASVFADVFEFRDFIEQSMAEMA